MYLNIILNEYVENFKCEKKLLEFRDFDVCEC